MLITSIDFKINSNLLSIISTIQNDFSKCIVPLFQDITRSGDSKDSVKLEGSSFYFTSQNKYFLSTATHVLYSDDNCTIYDPGRLFYPDTQLMYLLPIDNIYTDNDKDFSILRLRQPLLYFKPFQLTQNMIINRNVENFCCIGYPQKCSKQYKNNVTSREIFYLCNKENENAWLYDKKSFETPLKWIQSKCKLPQYPNWYVTFPKPEGISGGIVLGFSEKKISFYGILNRYNDEQKRTFFSTQVNFGHLIRKPELYN